MALKQTSVSYLALENLNFLIWHQVEISFRKWHCRPFRTVTVLSGWQKDTNTLVYSRNPRCQIEKFKYFRMDGADEKAARHGRRARASRPPRSCRASARASCRAAAGLARRGRGRYCRVDGGRPRPRLAMATASACTRSSAPPWPREGEHGLHEHASERADVGPSTGKGTPLAPMRRQASSWPECAAPCDGHW